MVRSVPLRLTVIGTGYLGAVHAACMADLGFEVIGVDRDQSRVEALARAEAPFFEPGLNDLLARTVASGRLRFTTSLEEAAAFGDVHFVCVGTPQLPGSHAADLGQVNATIEALGPLLTRPCLVVGKSTVPVGTAVTIAERLRQLAPAGDGVDLAWNPEFLREGFAIQDTVHPDRLVIGVQSQLAEATLREVYATLLSNGVPMVVTDYATAELVKVSANAFLATKISFINAMAEVCEAAGADVTVLARAIGYDERIGHRFLRAGLGFGGGCLPKDIRAFMARADELGAGEAVAFLNEVDAINLRRRARTVDMARELCGGSFEGVTAACLGAAFKPNSDDVRDSPALHVAAALQEEGATVRVYDPEAMGPAARQFPDLVYAESVDQALAGADVVLLLTEWDEFAQLTPERAGTLVEQRRIVDARNVLNPVQWREAGFVFRALGRP